MPARIFFDVTFSRTQVGNVGITRTVRQLREKLGAVVDSGTPVVPVAFHSTGYRAVDFEASETGASRAAASDTLPARILRRVSGSLMQRLVFAWAPVPLLHVAFRLYNRVILDRLTRSAPPVEFAPGDQLLLCDASWCCPAWEAAAAARARHAGVIVLLHDLIPLRQPTFSTPLLSRVFERWLAQMLKASDAVICNSRATEDDLRAYAAERSLALPATSHFRLGADLGRPSRTGPCRPGIAAFVSGSVPCFGVIGTIEPRKNHAWMLRVFESLWDKGHDIKLVVMGRVNNECYKFAQQMKTHPEQGGRLLTVFDASDEEVALVYAECRALVFPSLAEGFGLPLVEARTRGCPVIASDLPVFLELADAGVSLYERNSADALRALLLRHAAADRRVESGCMPPFTWEDSARQLLAVAQRLLAAAPTDGALRAAGSLHAA